jgi:hypothetical protein
VDGLVNEFPSVGLPNMVLGGRNEDRGGVPVDGSAVSPNPGGEVLKDG